MIFYSIKICDKTLHSTNEEVQFTLYLVYLLYYESLGLMSIHQDEKCLPKNDIYR